METNGAEIGVYSPTPINDGRPHHLVGTWSGTWGQAVATGQFALYVDGLQVTVTSPISSVNTVTAPLSGLLGTKIGHSDAWGTYFNGTIDDVAIYNYALSLQRVIAHHSAGAGYQAAVQADGPLAYFRLDDGVASSNVGPNTIISKPQYVQNDTVTPPNVTATSATGHYLIEDQAFNDVEDPSGNRYQCTYQSYDGQAFTTGTSAVLTMGELTTQDRYTSCGSASNNFTPSGQLRTTTSYDVFGN